MSKLVGMFKRGWDEIPEILGSSFMAVFGFGMGLVALKIYAAKDGDNKRYVNEYTVIRHDDPRAQFVKKD